MYMHICIYMYTYTCTYMHAYSCCVKVVEAKVDSLRGTSVEIGTIQRRLAWPLRKDDTHKSRSVNNV